MKGIVLAGGTGTRLHPITLGVSKQLLPIYDKPMIYYPISILMLAGIREILIITTPSDQENYKQLLGNGEQLGVSFSYISQPSPDGLAQAFILGSDFVGKDSVCLILGDNIFYGYSMVELLKEAISNLNGATLFAYHVSNPESFGVVEFDKNGNVKSIEEKPKIPKSNYAVTGLYFYNNSVIDIARRMKPSLRGEYEITDINKIYLENNELNVVLMGRGISWLDSGTVPSLMEAGQFIQAIEKRQGLKVACLEEIAWRKGWVTNEKLMEIAKKYNKTKYGYYLNDLLKEELE